jgi:two-component system chemotaxis sensor kinase CheA
VVASAAIAGVSLNDDGNPQLVLDPDGLVENARDLSSATVEEERPRPPLLVIDDSLNTRMLEQSILESAGYRVDVAASGEEGLQKAREKRYGLFLVDIEMPGIDGFTFVELTRTDPALKDVPSILVTSRESTNDRKRGEEAGAQGYVVKGEFNQEILLRRIKELVG